MFDVTNEFTSFQYIIHRGLSVLSINCLCLYLFSALEYKLWRFSIRVFVIT